MQVHLEECLRLGSYGPLAICCLSRSTMKSNVTSAPFKEMQIHLKEVQRGNSKSIDYENHMSLARRILDEGKPMALETHMPLSNILLARYASLFVVTLKDTLWTRGHGVFLSIHKLPLLSIILGRILSLQMTHSLFIVTLY